MGRQRPDGERGRVCASRSQATWCTVGKDALAAAYVSTVLTPWPAQPQTPPTPRATLLRGLRALTRPNPHKASERPYPAPEPPT